MSQPDYWRNERLQREVARLWADVMVLEGAADDALPNDARRTADPRTLRERAGEVESEARGLADDPHYDADADMQAAVRAAFAEAVALQERASTLEAAQADGRQTGAMGEDDDAA